MARKKTLQTSFAAGELAPEVAMRQDTDQYQNGAKSLLNRRMLIGGGHVRRPGSWLEATLGTDPVITEFIVNQTTQYILVFTAGLMAAYVRNVTTGHLTAAGSVAGPWTGTIYKEMDWVQRGNVIFLSHVSMITQIISRTGAATWTRADFGFALGPSSRPEQPYLKLAAAAITLAPSALTGSITLTASAASFVPAHGTAVWIRYLGKAMLTSAYISPTQLTANVIEALPPTQTLTVTSSAGFAVGEVAEGATSTAKGLVTGIPDTTHLTVVITRGLTPFAVENITGPNALTAISAVAPATPAAVTDWDEQLFGPIYGFPACIELHRNRLLFGGHPAAPDYLIGSVINNLYNFNVGTGADADAILESIGDAGASKIVQLCSAEQLLVLTDRGPYYVLEGPNSPFRPSSIAFLPFGSPWPINATAQVQAFDSGAVMVSGSLIIKARQTGNINASWDADEVSLLAPHLVTTPDRIAVTSNFGGNPERYAAFHNSDGTLALLQLVEAQKIRNFAPWQTTGLYLSVASIAGDLYASVARTINGATAYTLELFDQDITLDCATQYASKALMDAGVPVSYGSTTVNIVTPDYHLGTWPISLRTVPPGPFTVGLYYTSTIETLPPVIAGPEGPMAGDFMRIIECYVDVIASARFTAQGYTLSAYQVIDDVSLPPPLKTGPQRFQFLGWAQQPTITITQADPLPLKIRSIRSIVAY